MIINIAALICIVLSALSWLILFFCMYRLGVQNREIKALRAESKQRDEYKTKDILEIKEILILQYPILESLTKNNGQQGVRKEDRNIQAQNDCDYSNNYDVGSDNSRSVNRAI